MNEDDDNEFTRYLSSYLADNEDDFLEFSFDHLTWWINREKLEIVIKQFMESLL